VMWCGCGRGEFFEGCEQRRGDCPGTPTARCLACPGGGSTRNPMAGNAANPMTGSGMQQARNLPSGGSRRGGAKPRGRNTIRGRRLGTEPGRQQCRFGGVDARKACRWRGVSTPDFAGLRRPQGLQGPTHGASRGQAKLGMSDESQERRSEFRPGRQVSTLKGSQGRRVRSSSRVLRNSGQRRDTVGIPRRPAG